MSLKSAEPDVLLITDKFAPHSGGTATLYREWMDRLPSDRTRVCTSWFRGAEAFDPTRNYPITRVPVTDIPKVRMPLVWWRLRWAAERMVRERRPDVIHVGQLFETGWIALALKRRFGIPYVVHCYGEEVNFWSRYAPTRNVIREVLDQASWVTSISRYTQARLRELDLFKGEATLHYPGVDTTRFRGASGTEIRAKYAPNGEKLLLTVARLLPRKGHDHVLEMLPRLRREFGGLRYLIVGTGFHEPVLKAQAARLGLGDSVMFLGSLPHTEVPSYFAAADVFMHPNRQMPNGDVEGFGIVFLEAGAVGLPVIGGSTGGTPDAIVHGETGYLVDPDSTDDIEEHCLRILRDPALGARMGEAGRKWAEGFTWDAAAKRVLDISRSVAAGSVPKP